MAWSASRYERLVFYTLAVFYTSVLAFLLYYGVATTNHLQSPGGRSVDPYEDPHTRDLLSRVMSLCWLCASVMTLHVIYFLLSANRVENWDYRILSNVDDETFDAVAFVVLELAPTLFILHMLSRRSRALSSSPSSISSSPGSSGGMRASRSKASGSSLDGMEQQVRTSHSAGYVPVLQNPAPVYSTFQHSLQQPQPQAPAWRRDDIGATT
eukprot:CAMPEP_0118986122 /NCGR_PEP_ID=MMETSP1173-20130426/41502_1 /TAXON_ID=1034831 /ORGANISM="Rhizochromulina marina cf, Strain CCMP1243" /LENGTH=210 /DNA_ID=CAMNT_0006936885 /DNA_START=397 /DNA_END=1026 /DNA_ORIENTATION=-